MHHTPKGNVMLVAIIFIGIFTAISTALLSYTTAYARATRVHVAQMQALALAEAGIDKAAYELTLSAGYAGETATALGPGAFTVTLAPVDAVTKQITATGYVPSATNPIATRTVIVRMANNATSVTFQYGTQAGQGGIYFSNNSALIGNLFSNGVISGSNGAYITGDTYVAGPSGSITNMCIGGVLSGSTCTSTTGPHDVHAHSISFTKATGNLYCTTGTGNSGPCNQSQPDPVAQPYPVTEAHIAKWKSDAEAGTVRNGNYTLSSGTATLGPTKIIGNLTVSGTATLTLAGTVYVTGNVSFSGSGSGSNVKLSSAYGAQSGILVADGLISVGNNATFQDSGTTGSYIMLLSTSACDQSNSGSPCNGLNAIEISNNAAIIIANAQKGTVNFSNNATVKEVVGEKIRLKNNVIIQYGSGLPNTLFQSGTNGWTFVPGTYSLR